MKTLRLSVLGISLCAVLALTVPASAKAKTPNLAGLDQISGCAVQTTPWCKRLAGYALREAGSINGPVKTGVPVTVWGKKGPLWGIGCFGPYFEVTFWVRKPGVCVLR